MSFTEKVLVLRTGRFKEHDLWVRFLSPTRGVLTGFAFGGCRSRRRFCGCLDSLNLVLFTIGYSSGKRYLILQEGTLVSGFQELKNNREKLGMAVNCLLFVQKICPEGDDSSRIYPLILDLLKVMDKNFDIPIFFPLLFKARAAFIHGYEPVLAECTSCGIHAKDMQQVFFSISDGRVFCPGCITDRKGTLETGKESILFLDRLRSTGPGEWLLWNPKPGVLQDCFRLIDAYVQYHLD